MLRHPQRPTIINNGSTSFARTRTYIYNRGQNWRFWAHFWRTLSLVQKPAWIIKVQKIRFVRSEGDRKSSWKNAPHSRPRVAGLASSARNACICFMKKRRRRTREGKRKWKKGEKDFELVNSRFGSDQVWFYMFYISLLWRVILASRHLLCENDVWMRCNVGSVLYRFAVISSSSFFAFTHFFLYQCNIFL